MPIILKNELKNIEGDLVNRVKPLFGNKLNKIVLFGSYARGDYDTESDMDVMLMLDERDSELYKYYKDVTEIETQIDNKYNIFVCTLLMDRKKFENYQEILPFYRNINKEGVVLYEQSNN